MTPKQKLAGIVLLRQPGALQLFRLLFIAAVGISLQGVLIAEEQKPLSSIAECLVNVRSRTNTPSTGINITATVTFVDKERGLFFLQDDSAAMAVQVSPTLLNLQPGQSVRVKGNAISQYARAFPAYPDQPRTRQFLPSFETPLRGGSYYLIRIRGYLHPPQSGQYTFWTSADDAGELFLSSDATPARMKRIAMNRIGNATGPREWDRYPPQRSQPVTLTAGETYYVEALHLQSYGGDDFSVAWEGPGIERSVISKTYLTPWREKFPIGPLPSENSGSTNGLLCERWNDFVLREFDALKPRSARESFVRLNEPKVTVLGEPGFPPPLSLTTGDSLDTVSNLSWVELEGDVEFAAGSAGSIQISLRWEEQTLPVRVLNWPGSPPKDLTYSRVKIRGVLEHTYGPKAEWLDSVLWVPDREQVEIVAPVSSLGAATPLVPICELEPSNPQMSWGRRVKVHGRIVGTTNGLTVVEGYDQYQAQCSADGRTWVAVGKPVEAWMTDPLLTGVALASRHNQNAAIANFDRLNGWGTNWSCADVGTAIQRGIVIVREGKPLSMRMVSNTPVPTVFSSSEGHLKLTSISRQIGERVDQHFFVYQTTAGVGEFSTHLELEQQPTLQTHLGIMARESLEARSPYVAILFTPAGGPVLQYRRTTGEFTVGFPARPELAQHRWLKLIKRKSQLLVRGNPDGLTNKNRELEVTGIVTWQNNIPVLNDAVFNPVVPAVSNLMNQAAAPEQRLSLASFAAKAQRPPEPFLANRLAASGLKGVVTFSDRLHGTNLLFVQQGNDSGVQVAWPDNNLASQFSVGQLVEMSGRAMVRKSPVIIEPEAFKITGWGRLPDPAPYSAALVNNGSGQSRWIEAGGVVRSFDSNGVLRLMTSDGLLRVWVVHQQSAKAFPDYRDSVIRVRGVLTLTPDQPPTLLAPSSEFVTIQEEPPADPFLIPRFSIAQLAVLESKPEQQRQTKLTGTVTGRLPQGIFVQDETGGAFLQTGSAGSVEVGDPIEAVGFPTMDASSVVLSDVKLQRIAVRPKSVPTPTYITHTDQLAEDRHTHTLVNLTARLLEQRDKPEGQLLTLQSGALLFEAALLTNVSERLPELPIGSRLSICGVLQNNPTPTRGGMAKPKALNAASPFTIWLRQTADVVVLERPPWWTLKRLIGAGSLITCALLAALFWVRTLRRRVAQKTAELQVAMGQLEKETRTSAVLAERDRLAGEIHDSLQQGLAAIILQLDVANKHAEDSPEARRLLRTARSMAEFSRAEVEHAVWDLQSPLLDNADLGAALKHVASLISSGETRVMVEIQGSRRSLPSTIEHHLLRIGQEAITNAVKHARAKNICVTLSYAATAFQLTIQDDGCGFEPGQISARTKNGHFGLQGVHARAKKVAGKLTISSQPGQGTTITVRLDLDLVTTAIAPNQFSSL